MEDFPQPKQYSQVLNGVKYDVVEFSTNIYPTRTGEIDIGPAHIEGNLLYKAQDRRSNFFNDDFFNSFHRENILSGKMGVDIHSCRSLGKAFAVCSREMGLAVGNLHAHSSDGVTVVLTRHRKAGAEKQLF